ncbi:hypothetical protein FRB99_006493 [Tulasnella sp. 403]|nr:hypothetical protein FRB99_006493 [Tulasnella sp. 403]
MLARLLSRTSLAATNDTTAFFTPLSSPKPDQEAITMPQPTPAPPGGYQEAGTIQEPHVVHETGEFSFPETTEPVENSTVKQDVPSVDQPPSVPVNLKEDQPAVTSEPNTSVSDYEEPVIEAIAVVAVAAASEPVASHGTFAAGSGTAGPVESQIVETGLHDRAEIAATVIPPEEKSKIMKAEAKDAKKLAKIIKNEAKTEDKLLKTAIKELGQIQKVQKQAANDEAVALAAHAKTAKAEQKLNRAFLDAKGKHETALLELQNKAEKLEAVRLHAQQQTELLQDKLKEVEKLRAQKATDDREREAKLVALKKPIA